MAPSVSILVLGAQEEPRKYEEGGPSGQAPSPMLGMPSPAFGRLQACLDWLELLFLHPHFPLHFPFQREAGAAPGALGFSEEPEAAG